MRDEISATIIGLLDHHRSLLIQALENARPEDVSRADWMSQIQRWDDGFVADDYADMYRDADDQ